MLVPYHSEALTTVKPSTDLANDCPPLTHIVVHGLTVTVRPKQVMINGKKYQLDPYQLMRMIKTVTQKIGGYQKTDGPYSAYMTLSLRKARADMVGDLENHFRIYWSIDQNTGHSKFYM